MAYGGGTWLTQNKVLPGSYINFSSVSKASATLSDRGVAAAPFALDWGEPGVVKLVEQGDFQKNSFDLFGHGYADKEMLALREIFLHATKVYCYRLAANDAVKAKCDFATAKYPGTRGNDIRIAIDAIFSEIDDTENPGQKKTVTSGYTVTTYVGSKVVDEQTVSTEWADLKNNDWVDFKEGCKFGTKPSDAAEDDKTVYVGTSSTGVKLTKGENGAADGDAHQDFLNAIESYAFNALCCPVDEDKTTKGLYVAFTKRVRDKVGSKFQLVGYDLSAPDYEGIINLKNTASTASGVDKAMLTYWLTGAEAACNINESLTNTAYDGELDIITKGVSQVQSELEAAIQKGELVFHNSNGRLVILSDINSLVTLGENFGDAFQANQTIRVCDQIANDITVLFTNRYLGIVQNDATGRASLWNDIVCYLKEMQRLRAIENLDTEQITVELGTTKRSVLVTVNNLNIINAMEKLYMAVVIE